MGKRRYKEGPRLPCGGVGRGDIPNSGLLPLLPSASEGKETGQKLTLEQRAPELEVSALLEICDRISGN